MLQGVQPELQPDHAHAQAHGVQALFMRAVRQGVPAQGGPAPPPRLAALGGDGACHPAGPAPLQVLRRRAGGTTHPTYHQLKPPRIPNGSNSYASSTTIFYTKTSK